MSFTQHLAGPLGDQLARLTPGIEATAEKISQRLAQRSSTRPVDGLTYSDLGTVGQLVGQRIAEHVQPAPWYAALHGAVRTGALAGSEVESNVREYPTHALAPRSAPALLHRPTPRGWSRLGTADPAAAEESERLVSRAFAEHARLVASASEIGADELTRAQLYAFLSAFESIYRGSGDPAALQRACAAGVLPSVGPVGTDAANVLAGLRSSVAEQLASGYAAPTLVPYWAEADVLTGGCLIEIKATVSLEPKRIAAALRQLIGYALLDVGDRWRIHSVGLLLARQRVLWSWPRRNWGEVFGLRDVLGLKRRAWARRALEAAEDDGLDREVRRLWQRRAVPPARRRQGMA